MYWGIISLFFVKFLLIEDHKNSLGLAKQRCTKNNYCLYSMNFKKTAYEQESFIVTESSSLSFNEINLFILSILKQLRLKVIQVKA